MLETRIATTQAEKEAVFRSRYAIYVEEMGRYQATADHANKMLSDPEDDWSWIVYTTDGTDVVASTRMTWGGHCFSDRQIAQYGLAPFLAELPPETMLVGERTMISPSWRGIDLFSVLTEGMEGLAQRHGVRVVFGACEPHLLSFYCRYQRTYAPRNINSAEGGYLIPLISFLPDVDALAGLGGQPGLPQCIRAVAEGHGAVTSPILSDPVAYERRVVESIRDLPGSVFDGFTDDEIGCCIARSNVIECAAGDRVLKKGGAARNVFVVLSGALEVSNNGRVVGTVRPGEMFGETAYLLHGSRTFDVDALADGTQILSLSERTLRNLTDDAPVVAAKLLTNVSKVLCRRLSKAG
jgi:Cyclic nucleotide-binding domain